MSAVLRFWIIIFAVGLPLFMLPPNLQAEEASDNQEAPKTKTYRNTLLALGERQLKTGEINEALETFLRLVEAFPEDPHLYTRLGYVHLKRKDFKAAEVAFVRAKKLDKKHVEAYVGLGLTYTESPERGVQAYYNFRRAVGEAKRATKLDPEYGPAYRLLGEAYERFQEDHKRALKYYQKYIELESDNPEGLYYFGIASVQALEYGKINDYILPYLKEHPEVNQLVPLVAQGQFYVEKYQKALELFERYLQNIDGRERQLYTDITFVASDKELQAYELTVGAERQAYLEQFWARRDPDILTKINERIIEHYRRIWYARTFFSENAYPWDKRGEVYIRYGEPDHRSRSTDRQFIQTAEVEAVRTRMAVDIYGAEAAFLTFTGPVFPVRANREMGSLFEERSIEDTDEFIVGASDTDTQEGDDAGIEDLTEEEGGIADSYAIPFARDPFERDGTIASRLDEQTGRLNTRLQFGRYAPVTIDNEIDTVPWETWIYTQLEGGIEITFTDELGNGLFAFAPLPEATFEDQDAIQYIARMTEHTPEVLVQNAISRTPDFYRPGVPGDVMNFYYDLAGFKGADGQTAVEIYYGIPPEQVEMEQNGDSTLVHIQCALALADEGHTTIYRTAGEFFYRGTQGIQLDKGAFIPELLKTQVPPGKYELQVQLKDLISGRSGLYRQDLEINDYRPEDLQISDIQLASAINDEGTVGKFRKEDVWIIPMPTRNYSENQNVYAYFEIYNLSKNPYGQTRYKAQYLVRSSSMPSVGVFGAVASGLRAIFNSSKPQVSITYEQTGREPSEHEYVEIDLSKAKPGVNALEITIVDLVTNTSVDREVRFRYGN